jgi:hypothetical protein
MGLIEDLAAMAGQSAAMRGARMDTNSYNAPTFYDKMVEPAFGANYLSQLQRQAGANTPQTVYNMGYQDQPQAYPQTIENPHAQGGDKESMIAALMRQAQQSTDPHEQEALGRALSAINPPAAAPSWADSLMGGQEAMDGFLAQQLTPIAPEQPPQFTAKEAANFQDALRAQQRSSTMRAARDYQRVLDATSRMDTARQQEAVDSWARKHPREAAMGMGSMDTKQLAEMQGKIELQGEQERFDQYAAQNGLPSIPLVRNKAGQFDAPPWYAEVLRAQKDMQLEQTRLHSEAVAKQESKAATQRAERERAFHFQQQQLQARTRVIESQLKDNPPELLKAQAAALQENQNLYERFYGEQPTQSPANLHEFAQSKGVQYVVADDDDFDAVPSGERFVGADGQVRVKP